MARLLFFWRSNEEPEKFFPAREEDYWQNPVKPVAASMYQPLPYLPDAEDPVKFFPAREEDYYPNPVPPVQATLTRFFLQDPDDFPQQAQANHPEEVYWLNYSALPQIAPRQPIAEAEDAPALFGQPDEDFWVSGVAPVQAATYRDPVSRDAEDVPTLFGQYDEDFWVSGVAPVQSTVYRDPVQRDAEDAPFLYGQYEEDYWQSPIPAQGAIFRQPFTDDDLPVFVPAAPMFDEDFWCSGVAPVQASIYQRLPYIPDPEEIPAGSLTPPPPPPASRLVLILCDD
jgi:hypothetical protein